MMKYQAIITDLDGTALDSPGATVVSDRLAAAITTLGAQGVKVCAATGRPESYAMPVLTSMRLTEPCIVAGGTRIIDPVSRAELWRCGMSAGQVGAVVSAVRDMPYSYLWNDYVEAAYTSGGWALADFTEYDDTYFFEICYIPAAEVPQVTAALATIEGIAATVVVAQRPGTKDIHVTNAAATKEHAVYELEKLIGVAKEDMVGIGDGHNDIHLFNAVGHTAAMGNAVPELKSVADEVIGDVADDGLAVYFEELAQGGTA